MSDENAAMMVTIYISQLFNTGILIVLMNANFTDFNSETLSWIFFGGKLTDFGTLWYKRVGRIIVSAMYFGMFMPIIEITGNYVV